MSQWKRRQLGDLAEVKGGKRLPKGEMLVDFETPHPYISISDLGKKWIRKDGLQYVVPEIQKQISRYIVNRGDVILSIVGSIGFVGRISGELHRANLTENCVKFVLKSEEVDSDFLYYYLLSRVGQDEIEKRVVGSTQPKLPLYNIKSIEISLPTLPEQKCIAETLSSLDDKIDLLHRQNTTLEALAETLFRQWFVEAAKEEWEERKVGDIATHIKVGINPVANPTLMYCQYSLPAYDNGQVPTRELGLEILSNKYEVSPNTILISKLNPRFPRIWAIGDNVKSNSVCSTEFQVFKPKSQTLYAYFYFLIKSEDVVGEMTMSASGTSGSHQRIRPEDILNIKVRIPSIEKAEEFSVITQGFIDKADKNRRVIQTLSALRDTLLPKLMSGEVRVAY